MLSEVKRDFQRNIGPLVEDIWHDSQKLFRQEVTLVQTELKEELRDIKQSAINVIAAMFVLFLAGILLSFMAVYLVVSLLVIPPWVGFAIISIPVLLLAGLLWSNTIKSMEKLETILPRTCASLKEKKNGSKAI